MTVTALSPGVATTNPVSTPRTYAALSAEDPGITGPAYKVMMPRWMKCRVLMVGTEAVRADSRTYLPQFEGESDDAYDARSKLAALFPGFSRTVLAGVGMLFTKEPALSKEAPEELLQLLKNIDAKGTNWIIFTMFLVLHAMVDAMDGILVEHLRPEDVPERLAKASAAASVPGAKLDAADELALGLRPYWRLFRIDDIIKPIYENVNGARVLTLLSLRESVQRRVGTFGVERRFEYRVYTNEGGRGVIRYQKYIEPAGGGARLPEGPEYTVENQSEIPWSPLVAGLEISEDEYIPPLTYLADLNFQHHQVQTNILNLESLACVPTPVRIGAQRDPETDEYPEITIGPRSTIEAPAIQGVSQPFYWTSPDVGVLSPSQGTLESTEDAMAREGGAFLAPDPAGVESAAAKIIKGSAQRATLSTVARATQECLTRAVHLTLEYMKTDAPEVSVFIARDFEQPLLDAQTMVTYIDAVDRAGLPIRILLEAWKKGGRINDDEDLDELEQTMMANVAAKRQQDFEKAQEQAKLQAARGNVPPGKPLIPTGG